MGVHVAARIGALAIGGEILVSADSLAEAGDVRTANPASVAVRGVTTPVTVARVEWT
jgi:class 3 adenylate cyclase